MAPRMGKYGCFSEPSYIGIGDPYDKGKNAQNPRDTGLNFKASKCKTGKVRAACVPAPVLGPPAACRAKKSA